MEGEPAFWDLCFAIIKFCSRRLLPLSGHMLLVLPLWRGRVRPVLQGGQRSVPAPPVRSLRALASQAGPGRGHLPCSPALVLRDGLWAPSSPGEVASACRPVLQTFLMPGAARWEGGDRTRSVRGRCQAQLEESWPRDHLTTTTLPLPRLSPAARLIAERCKVGAGAGEVPPRPHVAAARGAVPGAQGGQVTTPGARKPGLQLPRPLRLPPSPPWSGRAAALRRDPIVSGPGRVARKPRRLRLAARALWEPAKARAQVAKGPDPCAPRSCLNPPLFPWQQTEVS